MKRNEISVPKKKRKPSEEITFEKHNGEPLTDEEQNELVDLIATIIFDNMIETASDKPERTT